MQFEAGHMRVIVKVQGYLKDSDQQVVCGQLVDTGSLDLDRGYDEHFIVLAHKQDVVMIGNSRGVIKQEDIVAIGRE
jgi:hypothetical protein